MCGFVGVVNFGAKTFDRVEPQVLERMRRMIDHRGPDDSDLFINAEASVGMGFVRLGIIDMENGRQPMKSQDEKTVIAFNGEIYDYQKTRKILEQEGFVFRTKSDTEVLLQSYLKSETNVARYLNGDFAFSIYDDRRKRVLIARDRFGVKPLYYHLEEGRIIFASEMKAILAHPDVARRINPTTVFQQMMRSDSLSRTLFQGIQILPPGHQLLIENGKVRVDCYYDIKLASRFEQKRPPSIMESSKILRQLVEGSVQRRLVSDFEVGCLLSGGLDSSIIAAIQQRATQKKIKTFSIRFSNQEYDESAHAKRMSQHIGSDHHEVNITSKDLVKHLPTANYFAEHLVQSTDGVGKYLLCKYARKHVKVVLSGEGADDIGLGLPLYRMAKALSDWDPERSKQLQHLISRSETAKKGQDLTESQHFNQDYLLKRFGFYPVSAGNITEMEKIGLSLFTDDFISCVDQTDARSVYSEISRPQGLLGRAPASQNQYEFMKTTLAYYVFQYLGGQSEMGASIEGRVPFLDNEVTDFAFSLPDYYHLFGMTEKQLLRITFEDLLPKEIAWRPKHGYSSPIFEGFSGPHTPDYFEYFLSQKEVEKTNVFSFKSIERLRKLLTRSDLAEQDRILNEKALFMVLSFQLLNDMFIENFNAAGSVPDYE
jgi:asparagine synthase (glutamine-hydrolysing)